MTAAHCSSPSTCSVCAGTIPRRVTISNGVTLVDGVPVSSDSTTATQMPQPRATRHRYKGRK